MNYTISGLILSVALMFTNHTALASPQTAPASHYHYLTDDPVSFTANWCCYRLHHLGRVKSLENAKHIAHIMRPESEGGKCIYYAERKNTSEGLPYLNAHACAFNKACTKTFDKNILNIFNGLLWSFKFSQNQYSLGEGCKEHY